MAKKMSEMNSRMNAVIESTWQQIGSDCAELGIRKPAEAAEMVLDANRYEMYGGQDKEAISAVTAMLDEDSEKAFKYATKVLKSYF